MAEFVRYTLADGTQVWFETAEADLVALHGGEPDVTDGGRLRERLRGVAAAAEEVAQSLRQQLAPNELALEFGLKLSGEVNWWFFAKQQAEGTIKVTLKWTRPTTTGQDEPDDTEDPETEADGAETDRADPSVAGDETASGESPAA